MLWFLKLFQQGYLMSDINNMVSQGFTLSSNIHKSKCANIVHEKMIGAFAQSSSHFFSQIWQCFCKVLMIMSRFRQLAPNYLWCLKKMKSLWLWKVMALRPWNWGSWGNNDASILPTLCPSRVLKLFRITSGMWLDSAPAFWKCNDINIYTEVSEQNKKTQ